MTLVEAQNAQVSLEEDRDEDRAADRIELRDGAPEGVRRCNASDEVLEFAGRVIDLPFDDFARKDDALEVVDVDFVIVKLISRVGGDHVSMPPDEVAEARQDPIGHSRILRPLDSRKVPSAA